MPDAIPAPCWTTSFAPRAIKFLTVSGVAATLGSRRPVSERTVMSMALSVSVCDQLSASILPSRFPAVQSHIESRSPKLLFDANELCPGLPLPQYPNYLLFREPARLHVHPSQVMDSTHFWRRSRGSGQKQSNHVLLVSSARIVSLRMGWCL